MPRVLYLSHAPEAVYEIIRREMPAGFELLTLAADDDWFTPEADLHVMLNMDDAPHDFAVPALQDRGWSLFADTAKPSPDDISSALEERAFTGERYAVQPRSIVILASTER